MSDPVLSQEARTDEFRARVLGDRLDRAMTVEVRPMTGGLPVGIVVPTYEICRKRTPGPLSTTAAAALADSVVENDTVWIVTGAGVAPALPQGETDGPPGAAALARALFLGLGARPVLMTEPAHAAPVRACAAAASPAGYDIPTLTVATGDDTIGHLQQLLIQEKPTFIVFVERDGANAEGRFHGIRGNARPDGAVAALDVLSVLAATLKIPTIGIGDGGNEVGFGSVRDQIAPLLPGNADSDEGWLSGRLTIRSTDLVLSASVSNWGSYAVCAALGVATGNLDACWTGELERTTVEASVGAGARDGATGSAEAAVDGIGLDAHVGVVELLRAIAATSL